MKSRLFHTDEYERVQQEVKEFINRSVDFLSVSTAQSPRAVGDAIENIVSVSFREILGPLCAEYSTGFARRSMADLAFTDTDGIYYIVDVKTHRVSTQFNMPNLTSVERLARFYEDDSNFFTLLIIRYEIDGTTVHASDVRFAPIEFFDWSCLTVGALGWGQIQIANANRIIVNPGTSRKAWMLGLCEAMRAFYPREIAKINRRMIHFEQVRDFWQNKSETE